jgi:hypothetical protein
MSVFNYAANVRKMTIADTNRRLAMGDFAGKPSYRAPKSKGPNTIRGVRGQSPNVRQLLMSVGGIGAFNVEMAIQNAFFMPRTTDPDSQPTITLIEGLQRALDLDVSGTLTPETVRAIRRVSGKNWMSKTWLQIYGDVGTMKKVSALGDEDVLVASSGLGDAFTTVPLVTLIGGAALLFLALKGK